MKARDLAYETFSALDANRGRSLLTVLGIVIGISAVIAMTALIGGVKQAMIGELGLNQARLVYIQCWYNRSMEVSDVEALEAEMADDYEYVTPLVWSGTDVISDTEKKSASIQGVWPSFFEATGVKLVSGRFFTEQESDTGALVTVLDQASVKNLFGNADAEVVGKTLRIAGAEYLICGVTESSGAGGSNPDYVQLYLPFSTCCSRVQGFTTVDQVYGFAREGSDMDAVAQRTTDWLARRFAVPEDERENAIWVYTMASTIEELNSMMMSFQVLMTSVASISLLVGGIGIMNMMLTNVTERIREIGLRKALGAKSRDITRQFLLESICLTMVGGLIGMALGYLGAFALSGLAGGLLGYGEGTALTPYLDLQSMLLVAGICVAIGVVFGYYPARRAARLDPVESLHYQ